MSFNVDETLLLACLRRGNPKADQIAIKKYDCKPRTFKDGSSYTSNMFSVSVEYECDGKLFTQFMVCKVPYLCELYASCRKAGFYDKETIMYETVIPKLMEILPLSTVPKHYFTTESDVLMLEDLTEQGYCLADQVQWNLERCVLLLEQLARFHAASVKLNREDAAVVEVASRVTFLTDEVITKFMKCVYPYLLASLQAEKVDSSVLLNFASYEKKINEGNIWAISKRVNDFNALIHGNLKANNIFLKNESNRSVAVKLVDYQTCMWNSPALDLLYFYLVTVDCDVFQKHQHEFLDRYLSSLNESLRSAGCDCTYTKDEYYADLAGSRLYQVCVLLFLGLYDVIEAIPGFHFTKNYPEVPSPVDLEKIRLNRTFRCRFLKWFRYFEKRGYFSN
ncbi:hypothetical protein V9T40_014742 [Parthenolecanium corni]|uniref:CHK kinase-like domain-containing protein n=1 Tax=Parthenolecanium corni TaxID=536013 RepID=A0AAN9T5A6_9HEMI